MRIRDVFESIVKTALFGLISDDFENRIIDSLVVVAVFVFDNGCALAEPLFPDELLYGDPVPLDIKQPFVLRAENRSPLAPSTGIVTPLMIGDKGQLV